MGRTPRVFEVGTRYGDLVVAVRQEGARSFVQCRCDCGASSAPRGYSLTGGHTTSCGCRKRVATAARNQTHGLSKIPEYGVWAAMLRRCTNPNAKDYPNYGGRGITVCERWLDFAAFHADMGDRPTPDHSIDRIENDGGYESGNCRWATRSEQMRNRRAWERKRKERCKRGHIFRPGSYYDTDGSRHCKECYPCRERERSRAEIGGLLDGTR